QERGRVQMERRLPIGIQSFEKLRRDGYLYVDKTALVWRLVQTSTPYFLSRPRRFGKSLLLSTIRAYFEGKRELFCGLAIEGLVARNADGWQARPVFYLDFNGQDYTTVDLSYVLSSQLRRWEEAWGTDGSRLTLGDRFFSLIELAHLRSGHRCVVLVDEYDKPLLETSHDHVLGERNRALLKGFLSVLKKADEHLRFVMVSGVTSGLNQLNDISLSREYATLCGVTEDELLATFGPEIDAMAQTMGDSREACLAALRTQYDGYRFHAVGPGVYNPFSLLKALLDHSLGSYWFETGTPSFLAQRMKEAELNPKRLTDGSIYATERRLSDYRANDPDPVPLLFQTGYLTIRSLEPRSRRYTLSVPNAEVLYGLEESLLPSWAPGYSESRGTDVFALWDLVEAGDTDGIRKVIEALFASIPYTRADDPFENYFQAVLWLVFSLLGRYVSVELRQATGRVDCVIEAKAHVYLIEFKRDGTAAEALEQIESRGYATPFLADSRQLHKLGCSFSSKTRLLADWAEG
ncbi:MAG: AAA family ATPase, partial [Coriobacteriales bacterium]|nr:AAA family ATPase [Coriobacteriales bacterium]